MTPYDDEEEEGELAVMEDDADVIDTDDGGAIVRLAPGDEGYEEEEDEEGEFYANLAEKLPDSELSRMATQLLDLIDKDKDARKKRDKQYEDGLRRTGLGDEAPGGAAFEGASKVVHPMLTEACIDFSARAMKEIFPPDGPAKAKIEGKVTQEKTDRADRKTSLMNWQLTTQAKEFRDELEQLLTQVPMGGAQYLKMTWDEARNRPTSLFIPIDDMLLPFAATSFYTAQRKTHRQFLTQLDYEERVKSGMYRDVDLVPVSMLPEESASGKASDKIEGREANSYNEDGLRIVYECYVTMEVEDGKGNAPYIISIDEPTRKVLSVYRNWSEDDASQEELLWIVEFPFIPWRGAYPIGFPHMIGGLSGAATGAIRALLDSAHLNNVPTALRLKGAVGGQSVNIQPTQIAEVEGGLNTDDIRKLAMPLPFNPPSATLYSLLGTLVETGKGVVRTSLDNTAENNPNAPVGTTLANIEQGLVVYSAIHARLHSAMGRVLQILHRLNALYLDDADIEREVGEDMATQEDFRGPMDVVPVSDPNIFSEAQRFAQIQAVAQRADARPQLYDQRKVEERILNTLKLPDAEDLLLPAVEPENQNAIAENVAASLGRSIVAYPEQDHMAHLKAHVSYMGNPMLGSSPMMAGTCLPVMLNHLKEHIALWYMTRSFEMAEEALGVEDLDELLEMHETDEDGRKLDQVLAETGLVASEQAMEIFAELPAVIQKAQELLKQYQPPPPIDVGTIEKGKLELQHKALEDKAQDRQSKAQIETMKIQSKAQMEERRDALKAQMEQLDLALQREEMEQEGELAVFREGSQDQRTQAEIAAKMTMNEADNATAMSLAQLELRSGERFAVSTGTGINPRAG